MDDRGTIIENKVVTYELNSKTMQAEQERVGPHSPAPREFRMKK